MSFALVLKKMSWYRRRYSRPIRVKVIGCAEQKPASATVKVFKLLGGCYKLGKPICHQKRRTAARVSVVILFRSSV